MFVLRNNDNHQNQYKPSNLIILFVSVVQMSELYICRSCMCLMMDDETHNNQSVCIEVHVTPARANIYLVYNDCGKVRVL